MIAIWHIWSKTVNKQLTYEKNVNIPNDRLWMMNAWVEKYFSNLERFGHDGQ